MEAEIISKHSWLGAGIHTCTSAVLVSPHCVKSGVLDQNLSVQLLSPLRGAEGAPAQKTKSYSFNVESTDVGHGSPHSVFIIAKGYGDD